MGDQQQALSIILMPTLEEFIASADLKAIFDQIDADGDGKITKAELSAAFENIKIEEAIMSDCDADDDGNICHQEWCTFLHAAGGDVDAACKAIQEHMAQM